MKRITFLIAFIAAGMLFTNRIHAQLSVSLNIGNQPAWAPEGYDEAQYYYIPDMDMYYDVPAHQFVYMNNRSWVRSSTLPSSYRKFDLYSVHKVPINQKDAYKNHDRDKRQYAQFKGKSDQHPIRDSRDNKYAQNKNNWNNNQFKGQSNNGNNGNNGNKDKGKDSKQGGGDRNGHH